MNVPGDLVVGQSHEYAPNGDLFLVHWNNAAGRYVIMKFTDDAERSLEHGAFAPVSL